MGIVGTVVLGFLAGIVAKVLMPGKAPGGLVVTTSLGIGGAGLASYLRHRFHWTFSRDPHGFLAAVAGAFFILMVYRLVFHRRK
ncbi:MAG: GlsB/YeaQ/YmgE family stress response membrane protein [Elusimicrobia bacterium]|nr:GlsB/YeaQ/YmgE family stress response membrane protein [Elusimicrobiota bacterium]